MVKDKIIGENIEMAETKDQSAFLKEMQARLDRKIKENEIDVLEYWKEHLDKLAVMKPEGIASLQTHIRKIAGMMGNRVMMLKRG